MLLEPPKTQMPKSKTLAFAETTQQWTYETSVPPSGVGPTEATTEAIEAKNIDGPNEYSIFFGRVVAGYLMNLFTDTEGLRSVFGAEHVNTLGPYLVTDVQHLADQLKTQGISSLYYNAYRIGTQHGYALSNLLNILQVLNLENRLNGLVHTAKTVREQTVSVCATTTTTTTTTTAVHVGELNLLYISDSEEEECMLDDLERRFTNILNL